MFSKNIWTFIKKNSLKIIKNILDESIVFCMKRWRLKEHSPPPPPRISSLVKRQKKIGTFDSNLITRFSASDGTLIFNISTKLRFSCTKKTSSQKRLINVPAHDVPLTTIYYTNFIEVFSYESS